MSFFRQFIAFLFLGGLVLATVGCSQNAVTVGNRAEESEPQQSVTVKTVAVTEVDVRRSTVQPATVYPYYTAAIRAKVHGYVKQVQVDIGDAVVIARRAAGLIEFGQLNASPVVTLTGDGDVVSLAAYMVRGTVSDDGLLVGGTLRLLLEGTFATGDLSVAADGSFAGTVTLVDPTSISVFLATPSLTR